MRLIHLQTNRHSDTHIHTPTFTHKIQKYQSKAKPQEFTYLEGPSSLHFFFTLGQEIWEIFITGTGRFWQTTASTLTHTNDHKDGGRPSGVNPSWSHSHWPLQMTNHLYIPIYFQKIPEGLILILSNTTWFKRNSESEAWEIWVLCSSRKYALLSCCRFCIFDSSVTDLLLYKNQ